MLNILLLSVPTLKCYLSNSLATRVRTVFILIFIMACPYHASGQVNDLKQRIPYRAPLLSNFELFMGGSMLYFTGHEFYRKHDALKTGFATHLAFVHEFNDRFQMSTLFGYENKGRR